MHNRYECDVMQEEKWEPVTATAGFADYYTITQWIYGAVIIRRVIKAMITDAGHKRS